MAGGLTCRDETGQPVDWWFIYKLPDGFDYAYRDVNTPAKDPLMPIAGRSLNCTKDCALGSTLHQVYINKTGLATVLYNDEPPPTTAHDAADDRRHTRLYPSTETAHAKGILAYDGGSDDGSSSAGSGGFWLIHSVPKFPDLSLPRFTWTASTTYGQSFLCITLPAAAVDQSAFQLRHVKAQIFSQNAPSWLPTASPNMSLLLQQTPAAESNSSVAELTTKGGVGITHFAKSAVWGQDLYEDLVEPYYEKGFMWETWRRKPYTEPTYCRANASSGKKYDSVNVMSIRFGQGTSRETVFKYTRDHCKWGISAVGSTVCIGDINRMTSQKKRGGGTACIESAPLWNAIDALINSTDSCVPAP